MGCCNERKQHTCQCQGKVASMKAVGLALWSTAPTVAPLLRTVFAELPGHPGIHVIEGDGFLDEIESFLDPLSRIERLSIRAVPIYNGQSPMGWTSAKIDQVLTRLRTPWLPEMLNDEAIQFHYQPIVDGVGKRVIGFEMLMRTPELFVDRPPARIIEAARSHGALLKLDQIARRQAIMQSASNVKEDEYLFINFMPMTVYNPDVCLRTTFDAVNESGLDISQLVFEVVESEAFPDIDHLGAILAAYRKAGARVALDDLGTGNTAMVYIDQLRPDIIKLDREMIRLAASKNESSMLAGIVSHAKALGIQVLAEGVETEAEFKLSQQLGVDFVQGWYFGRASAKPVRELHTNKRNAA